MPFSAIARTAALAAQDIEIFGTVTGTVDGVSSSGYATAAKMQGETVSQSKFTGDPASRATVLLFSHASESVMPAANSILLSFTVTDGRFEADMPPLSSRTARQTEAHPCFA